MAGWQSSDDPTERLAAFNDFSADQIAFTLTWSRPSAESFMELGWDLTRRLPMVFEALRQGRLDLPRARLFSLALALLDDQTAQAIAAKLIDDAGNATYSVLAKRLRRLIIIADPAAAKRGYQRGVVDRSISLGQADNATATLIGSNLPVPRALAANNYLDRLAAAAKAAGDPRTLTQLRADAALDLLRGEAFRTTPTIDPLTEQADEDARAEQAADRQARHAARQAAKQPANNQADHSGAEGQPCRR